MTYARKLGTTLVLALLLSPVARCRAAEGAGELALEIVAPSEGKNRRGAIVSFGAKLRNAPAKRLLVRVAVAGVTHHILIDPEDPWTGQTGQIAIGDYWFLAPKGPQIMSVDVMDASRENVLYNAEVPFAVEQQSEDDFNWAMGNTYSSIISGARQVRSSYADFTSKMHERRSGKEGISEEDVRFRERYYLNYVNFDLISRTDAYSHMATVHEQSFLPGDALACLRYAEEIFEKEKGRKTTTPHFKDWPIIHNPVDSSAPPGHFEGYALFYARRGALSNAVEWLEKKAEWYVEQANLPHTREEVKPGIHKDAAETYRTIAHLHMILNKDLEGYERYMKKFYGFLPKKYESRSPFGLVPVAGVNR
ncbi:MAG: hypothetical protein JXP34_14550 [Planctomycetes bacterium]|nr:hypothetical protein [Planctomycetota bacterium]